RVRLVRDRHRRRRGRCRPGDGPDDLPQPAFDRSRRAVGVEGLMMLAASSSGWFLDNAWLIPVIPAIAFVVIIVVGTRLPRGGSEVGIASMLASLVIAAGTTIQWISRVDDSHGEHVEAVIRQKTWW